MRKAHLLIAALVLACTGRADAGSIGSFLKNPVGTVFEKIAQKKGDRVFHEKGQAYHASFSDPMGGTIPAVVRLSRGRPSAAGQKEILGVAVKVKTEAGDQDFLMVTARGKHGIKARIPTTRERFAGQTFSSLLPFREGSARGPITTQLPAGITTPVDASGTAQGSFGFPIWLSSSGLRDLVDRALMARVPGGQSSPGMPVGYVQVDFNRPLDARENATLEFSPFNDGQGVKPVGLINAIRKLAYRGSQAGRGIRQ